MSGIALGTAYAAVQLVHQAHSKVKTSKARCARLVARCQFVVDRLERIAVTKGGDSIIRERIYELERAFEQTARTIVQVGQQGIIASLLRAEANAQRIEACNEVLTELISLFNLEELVDVRRWQTDLEVARVRDHRELLSMGRRIESSNAAINRELALQGATITEVLRNIHDINAAGLQNAHLDRESQTLGIAMPLTIADTLGALPTLISPSPDRDLDMGSLWSAPLPKAKVTGTGTGTGTLASGPPTLCIPCASPRTAAKPRSSTLRRLTYCVKMVPLTKVFSSKQSSSSSSRGAATAAHPAMMGSSSPSTTTAPNANVVKCGVATPGEHSQGDSGSSVSSCDHPRLAEPPPPYQLRVANPAPTPTSECDYEYDRSHGRGRGAATVMSSSSRFTAASVEAIRAPDSPVPTFPSPKLSTESVFGSTRSLASVSGSEYYYAHHVPASSANGIGTISEPRYICTLRDFAARGDAAGPSPTLRRKNTIGFARRDRDTLSSGYRSSVKRGVSTTRFRPS